MYKLAVIIPAAGSGSRMGSQVPKPFLMLGNQAILWHTIRAFLSVEEVEEVIIPTSSNWISEVQTICDSFSESGVAFKVLEGGTERQFSIQNALNEVSLGIDLVAVHDAVRPFINSYLIKDCADKAFEMGGAMIAVPAKDTVKVISKDGFVKSTPDRSTLWQAQTPQIFKTEILKEAYRSAMKNQFVGTDDASLVEAVGGKVKIVEGDRENLKITYPVDLRIAELILNGEKMI